MKHACATHNLGCPRSPIFAVYPNHMRQHFLLPTGKLPVGKQEHVFPSFRTTGGYSPFAGLPASVALEQVGHFALVGTACRRVTPAAREMAGEEHRLAKVVHLIIPLPRKPGTLRTLEHFQIPSTIFSAHLASCLSPVTAYLSTTRSNITPAEIIQSSMPVS